MLGIFGIFWELMLIFGGKGKTKKNTSKSPCESAPWWQVNDGDSPHITCWLNKCHHYYSGPQAHKAHPQTAHCLAHGQCCRWHCKANSTQDRCVQKARKDLLVWTQKRLPTRKTTKSIWVQHPPGVRRHVLCRKLCQGEGSAAEADI